MKFFIFIKNKWLEILFITIVFAFVIFLFSVIQHEDNIMKNVSNVQRSFETRMGTDRDKTSCIDHESCRICSTVLNGHPAKFRCDLVCEWESN